jgi:hypothetical protein
LKLTLIVPLAVNGPAESMEAHRGALSMPQVHPALVTRLRVTVEACGGNDNIALGEKA